VVDLWGYEDLMHLPPNLAFDVGKTPFVSVEVSRTKVRPATGVTFFFVGMIRHNFYLWT
jgi:hypothetical protein